MKDKSYLEIFTSACDLSGRAPFLGNQTQGVSKRLRKAFVYFVIKKFILKKAQYKKYARQDRVHITKSSFQQKIDHKNLVK